MTFKNTLSSSRATAAVRRPYALGLIALAFLSAAMALPVSAQNAYLGSDERGQSVGAAAWGASPHRMERMLSSVNASDAQREQIKQILKNSADDRAKLREDKRALREQAIAVFTAPTVDAHAVEQLRQQMLAQQDQSSRRMMAVMLEVSNVLTAEQRAQLAAHMQQHRRGRHHKQGH